MVQCSVSVTRLLLAVAVADSDSGDIHGGYERGEDEEGHDVVTQCCFVRFTITNVNEYKAVLAVCPKHLKDHSKREQSREANQITDSKLSPQLTLRNIQDTMLNLKHQ